MSWGIQKICGTPEKVRPSIVEAFDKVASYYQNTNRLEFDDIIAAKTRVLAWLDAVKTGEGFGVLIEAAGSQGTNGSTSWQNLTINCSSVRLA